MRVFFLMHYPGYLRYFDTTIAALADRGHDVLVAFNSPSKQREGLEALAGMPARVQVVERPPKRRDGWEQLALELRRTVDYARYLHPRMAGATYLRGRIDDVPRALRHLTRLERLPARQMRRLYAVARALEGAIPSDAANERYLRALDPTVVLVSPLVTQASRQTDVVKSAQALGIPTGLCVASWDHLTTKGLVRILPDRLFVWNPIQRQEAREFHGVDSDRVVVTGAQPFDRWFGRQPSLGRAEFCRRVGLPDDRSYVLFVGSTASISSPRSEQRFVRAWIDAIRASRAPEFRSLGVLVRPHPYNPGDWTSFADTVPGPVAVWPPGAANPVDEGDRDDYFHSLYHSVATVGINTSAMIEAAIVGRPVLTIRAQEFVETQELTIHFQYLLPENGGPLEVAHDLAAHVRQLEEVVGDPEGVQARLRAFTAAFIRPQGLDRPSLPALIHGIEQLGVLPTVSRRAGVAERALRSPLRLLARRVAGNRERARPVRGKRPVTVGVDGDR